LKSDRQVGSPSGRQVVAKWSPSGRHLSGFLVFVESDMKERDL